MEEKFSTKGSFCGIEYGVITVQIVLEQALECAKHIHNKKENMPRENEKNGNKENLERWVNLDKKFKVELQKISGPKVDKMDKKAIEEIGAGANVNAEH
jgi:hypothetical protein